MKMMTLVIIGILMVYTIGYFSYRSAFINKFSNSGDPIIGLSTNDKGMKVWYYVYGPMMWAESFALETKFYGHHQVKFE